MIYVYLELTTNKSHLNENITIFKVVLFKNTPFTLQINISFKLDFNSYNSKNSKFRKAHCRLIGKFTESIVVFNF